VRPILKNDVMNLVAHFVACGLYGRERGFLCCT
jgi:hypothetical protein